MPTAPDSMRQKTRCRPVSNLKMVSPAAVPGALSVISPEIDVDFNITGQWDGGFNVLLSGGLYN